MRTLGIFTGTRAEYGLLRRLIETLKSRPDVAVKIIASGAHLSTGHGETSREIEADGHRIDERVEILLASDTDAAIATAMGLGLLRYPDAYRRLRLDALVVLGDRYEAFAAAAAALVAHLPVAHIHGGEVTRGALDDAFRHAITKMSRLHFVSTAVHRDRVVQMGESPDTVFDVGALGVENALALDPLPREEVAARLGLLVGQPYGLATFHPATLDGGDPEAQLRALLQALERGPDLVTVFTGANADAGGGALNAVLEAVAAEAPERIRFSRSLGARLYLSALRGASLVIGNSSSGVIEAPSFGVPVIDIGSRQAGRIRAESVIWCEPDAAAIEAAIGRAVSPDAVALAAAARNPYGKPGTAAAIAEILATAPLDGRAPKTFHDLPAARQIGSPSS